MDHAGLFSKRRIRAVKEAQCVYHNEAKVVVCGNDYALAGRSGRVANRPVRKSALGIHWLCHARRSKGPSV
jgi:hypothetical protein